MRTLRLSGINPINIILHTLDLSMTSIRLHRHNLLLQCFVDEDLSCAHDRSVHYSAVGTDGPVCVNLCMDVDGASDLAIISQFAPKSRINVAYVETRKDGGERCHTMLVSWPHAAEPGRVIRCKPLFLSA